ncbi:hypothetical protein RHGRI_033745 [Rhododendron griersonianum]|uniref:F-box domain-containing protein n=1 Tax=Rhododendron griersonianum TaxID=479676 RepID=A0AAV6HY04_9ERIC|nr:hypothetical protein RHGRI_033745 [Rhododendron griersonianum]
MKRMCSSTSDIISDLPDNILEKILVLMPLRDAVRTSVLSKKWRDNWRKIPELAFDDRSLVDPYPILFRQRSPPDQLSIKNRFFATIYHVLLRHQGAIPKLILSLSELEGCFEIDTLIITLSSNGIQELTVKLWKGQPYKLPQSLYTCQRLTHLNLQHCVFRPPTTFKGFRRIVYLELYEVIITSDAFQNLVSSCPLLEKLKFESSACFDYIGIDASNLKVLSLTGFFKSLRVKNARHLTKFSLYPKACQFGIRDAVEWAGLLDGLPVLEHLHMGGPYVWANSTSGSEEAAVKACEEKLASSKFCLKHLREVEMRLVSDTKIELHFMKLLLAKSRVLESMVVKAKSS